MPPGTGVRQPGDVGDRRVDVAADLPSSPRFRPTSITVAPGLTMSGVTIPGTPTAATTMSRARDLAAEIGVREWQIVTVAFAWRSSIAAGRPTISLRPITTASFPFGSTPYSSSSAMQPAGVAGTCSGVPR